MGRIVRHRGSAAIGAAIARPFIEAIFNQRYGRIGFAWAAVASLVALTTVITLNALIKLATTKAPAATPPEQSRD